MDHISKKHKKLTNIKPFHVKNHLWLFVNCLIENPTFDSQTKVRTEMFSWRSPAYMQMR